MTSPDDRRHARQVPVWDLPTRLFHWLLVVLIALLYASGEYNLLDMRWHFWCGYATLALILFRVLWGVFGSQTSRFSAFVRSPVAVARYGPDAPRCAGAGAILSGHASGGRGL